MTYPQILRFLIEKLLGSRKPTQDYNGAGNGLHERLQNENLRIIYQDKLGILSQPEIDGETPNVNNNLSTSATINFSFELECFQTLICSYCSKSLKILNYLLSAESLSSAILILLTIYTHFSDIPFITTIIILTILFIEILLKTSSSLNFHRLAKILQSLMQPFSYIEDSSHNLNTPNNIPSLYFSLLQVDCLFFESLSTQLSAHLQNNLFSKTTKNNSNCNKDHILKIQAALENQQSSFYTSRYTNNYLENKKNDETAKKQISSEKYPLINDQNPKNMQIKKISASEEGLIMIQTAYRKDQFIKEAFSELYRFIQFKIMFLSLKLFILIHLRKQYSESTNSNQTSNQETSWDTTMPLLFQIAIFLAVFLRIAAQVKISSIYMFRNEQPANRYQQFLQSIISSVSHGILIIVLGNACVPNSNLEKTIVGVYFVSAMIVFFMEDGNKNANNQYGQLYQNRSSDFEVNNPAIDAKNSDFPRRILEPRIKTFVLNSSISSQQAKQSMCILQLLIGLCFLRDYPYSGMILVCLNAGMLIFYYAKFLHEKRNQALSQFYRDPTLTQSSPQHIIYTGHIRNLHSNEFIKQYLKQLVQSCDAHIILSFPQDQVKVDIQFGHVEIFLNNSYNSTLIHDIQHLMANYCFSYVFKILNVSLLHSQLSFILHTILFEFDTQHNLALCPINYLLQLPISDKNKYYFLPLIHQMSNNKLIQVMKVSVFHQLIAPNLFQNPGAVLYDLLMLED